MTRPAKITFGQFGKPRLSRDGSTMIVSIPITCGRKAIISGLLHRLTPRRGRRPPPILSRPGAPAAITEAILDGRQPGGSNYPACTEFSVRWEQQDRILAKQAS